MGQHDSGMAGSQLCGPRAAFFGNTVFIPLGLKSPRVLTKLSKIDEVHALKEGRGATLEVVVSRSGCPAGFERKMLTWRRMRSTKSDVRFVALSATIPNAPDICSWLGRGPSAPDTPAKLEIFGSEFRPVKLQKYVYGFPCQGGNDFGFDKTLDRAYVDPTTITMFLVLPLTILPQRTVSQSLSESTEAANLLCYSA